MGETPRREDRNLKASLKSGRKSTRRFDASFAPRAIRQIDGVTDDLMAAQQPLTPQRIALTGGASDDDFE